MGFDRGPWNYWQIKEEKIGSAIWQGSHHAAEGEMNIFFFSTLFLVKLYFFENSCAANMAYVQI